VLPTFTVTEQVHDQDGAAQLRPRGPHALQLLLSLRIVMAVTDDQRRHLPASRCRPIPVGGHDHARAALEHEIVYSEPVSLQGSGDGRFEVLCGLGEGAEGVAQRLDAFVPELLPLRSRPQQFPGLVVSPIRRIDLRNQVPAEGSNPPIAQRNLIVPEPGSNLRREHPTQLPINLPMISQT
jgi:hypothetical protein